MPMCHQCATPFINYVYDVAVGILVFAPLLAPKMDKELEADNLEMRLRALESRIYGERRGKSGKSVKVRSEQCYLRCDGC